MPDDGGSFNPKEPYLKTSSDATTLVKKFILTPEQRERCLDSLKFKQIESHHATIKSAHTKTCRWLLTKSEYQEWLDNNKLSEHHGLFWIKGNPGTGKSTIMKFAFANTIKNAQKNISNAIVISLLLLLYSYTDSAP